MHLTIKFNTLLYPVVFLVFIHIVDGINQFAGHKLEEKQWTCELPLTEFTKSNLKRLHAYWNATQDLTNNNIAQGEQENNYI